MRVSSSGCPEAPRLSSIVTLPDRFILLCPPRGGTYGERWMRRRAPVTPRVDALPPLRSSRRPHLPAARIGGEASPVSSEGTPPARIRGYSPGTPLHAFLSRRLLLIPTFYLLLDCRIPVLFARGN